MDSEMVKALDPIKLRQPRVRFANSKDFANAGDSITGLLVHYHPTWGATDFDGNNCGVLVLMEGEGGAVKIALDKGQLATAADNAIMFAHLHMPGAPKLVRVTYEGKPDGKDYKRYSVHVGACRNLDLAADLLA